MNARHLVSEWFPARLRQDPRAPKSLFVKGELPGDSAPALAIVGARAASGHGMATAQALAEGLADRGWVIISGGATGVDAAAHRGALAAGGKTVAVLGTGIDVVYPAANRELFERIVGGGGALVTPFADGQPPRAGHFVRRNRIIAAMADAVVVVDAGLGSGALHTAQAALDLGRGLGALPGTAGCQALIAQGAAVVESADDVEALLGGAPRRPVIELPVGDSEAGRVLAALRAERAFGADEIATTTGLGPVAVTRALTGLELEGLAVLAPGGRFARSHLADELLSR